MIAVAIDIYNLEAEAYRAQVAASTPDAIPAIHKPLLTSLEEGIRLPPFDLERDGRIAMMLAVAQRLKREFPEADVRLPVGGPFSIAFNLRGINDLCLDAVLTPELLAQLLMRLAENQAVLCQAVAAAGLDVAFFESAAAPPILSPRQFHELEMPALRRVLEIAADAIGHPVPCIMGGNTYPGPRRHPLHRHELPGLQRGDQPGGVRRAVSRTHPHVKIRVNLDPGVRVSAASPQRIYRGGRPRAGDRRRPARTA